MKFSFGRGGGQISLNQKISQNKVSYIGLKYLIPDGWVQNPKLVFNTTPYMDGIFTRKEILTEKYQVDYM